MQETSGARGLAQAGMTGTPDAEVEALRAELAKWQERVPKLAGALRERTGELEALQAEREALKAELAARPDTPPGDDAADTRSGIVARDALIEELESKVRALGGKYQDAEGQLHARDLEITQLRQEAAEWREKWQSVTTSLDSHADTVEQKERELKRLQQELDDLLSLQDTHTGRIKEQDLELTALRERAQSLEARNENLFETTELANRQIETLGENLDQLRGELGASKKQLDEQANVTEGLTREIDDLKAQVTSRDQDIGFLHNHVEEKQSEISRLTDRLAELEPLEAVNAEGRAENERLQGRIGELDEEINGLSERLVELDAAKQSVADTEENVRQVEARLAESRTEVGDRERQLEEKAAEIEAQKEEVRHLESCVANAEEATIRHEVERRQLSERLDELKKRNQHLEAQLTERSDLVVGLEQEKSAISDRTSSLEAENQRLSEALEKAQQAAQGNADHIAQVDARMERQKQLMENLEEEFAEVQEEYADAVKAHQRLIGDKDSEIAALREKVDEDSVQALKHELGELEQMLGAAEDRQRQAEARAGEAEAQLVGGTDERRDLEARLEEETQARRTQADKVGELEKQLKKQTEASAEAEEAAASARRALEEARAANQPGASDLENENAALQAEVVKLEGMVRERTEQLNKLRWQQDMIEKQGMAEGSDSKMLVVLSQQLQSAREDNQRLKDRVRELEDAPVASAQPASAADEGDSGGKEKGPDDLSAIKGIGPKLVKQLRKLGVTRFDQIATLSEADLDDKYHPLHAMKGRIQKDNWIAQAAKLGGI